MDAPARHGTSTPVTEEQLAALRDDIRRSWKRPAVVWALILGAVFASPLLLLLWFEPTDIMPQPLLFVLQTCAVVLTGGLVAGVLLTERLVLTRLCARLSHLRQADQDAVLGPLQDSHSPLTKRIARSLRSELEQSSQKALPIGRGDVVPATSTSRGDEPTPIA